MKPSAVSKPRALLQNIGCRHWSSAAFGVLVFALVQRTTFRDTVRGLDLVFYALPYPMIALGASTLVLYFMWRRRRYMLAASLILLAVTLPLWLRYNYIRNHSGAGASDFVIQYWNTARAKNASEVLKQATARGGDIIALVEAGADRLTTVTWQQHLPGYEVRKLAGGMLLAVRGSILDVEFTPVGSRRARFNTALVRIEGESTHTLRIILVDIHSNPLYDKSRPFNELVALVHRYSNEPLIVAGDFNTPLESVQFRKLRAAGLTHAFESSGNGFVETYLFGMPILAIDHIWTNEHLRPVKTDKGPVRGSDHQPLVAGVTIPATGKY